MPLGCLEGEIWAVAMISILPLGVLNYRTYLPRTLARKLDWHIDMAENILGFFPGRSLHFKTTLVTIARGKPVKWKHFIGNRQEEVIEIEKKV